MSDEPLRYETERAGGELRVRIFGELDMSGTLRIEHELERAIDSTPERLVVDLEHTTFIDSTGMNLLITIEQEARSRGIEVELVPGPREVMRVLATTGLVDVLPFRPAS